MDTHALPSPTIPKQSSVPAGPWLRPSPHVARPPYSRAPASCPPTQQQVPARSGGRTAGARDLTAGEAEEVRAACLEAFDDRQAERRRLLSLRLAEGGAELARLRTVELAHLSPADQERFKAEEAGAAFRLRVVQRRLEEHAPAAAGRRAELEARLVADRRLAAALAPV